MGTEIQIWQRLGSRQVDRIPEASVRQKEDEGLVQSDSADQRGQLDEGQRLAEEIQPRLPVNGAGQRRPRDADREEEAPAKANTVHGSCRPVQVACQAKKILNEIH